MVPVAPSSYRPPLDQCLAGEKQLLSWRLAFSALAEDIPTVGQTALRRFLTDSTTIDVLINSLRPQTAPSAASRSRFDNETSAINVTPNGNGKYNLQQIKDDTLWLSQAASVDELCALRMIVLEWQSRSSARLLHDHEAEELPAFSGSMRLKSSLLLSRIRAPPKAAKTVREQFESEVARRDRILNTYLSERRFKAKTLGHVLFRTLCEKAPPVDATSGNEDAKIYDRWSWVERAGTRILEAWSIVTDKPVEANKWFLDVVSLIAEDIDAIAAGSKIEVDDAVKEELEMRWVETQATEILHLMHIAFIVAQSSQTLWTSECLSAWFKLMDQVSFFGSLELPFEALNEAYIYNIRSMATMTSLSILNLPVALDTVPGLSSGALTNTDAGSTIYLQNVGCVHEITMSLLNSAATQSLHVKPVALAWSVILQDARAYADSSQLARDNRHAQRAADSIGSSAISDTESIEGSGERRRSSPNRRTSFGSDNSQQLTYLEEVVDALQKIDPADDVINLLARSAVQEPSAFEVMTDISLIFSESFGFERHGSFGLRFRTTLLDLTTASLVHIDYQPDIVATVLAILTGGCSYWDSIARYQQRLNFDIVSHFRSKDMLMTRIFETARTRFPYESLPYLKLCQALAAAPMSNRDQNLSIATSLESLPTLTSIFYEGDAAYELTGEGDNMYIVLQSALDISATGQGTKGRISQLLLTSTAHSAGQVSSDAMILPSGTSGRPLTDGKPLVVMFRFPYSGLKYMGLVLRQALQARTHHRVELTESISEIANEIIGLLSRMLSTAFLSTKSGTSLDKAQSVARSILEEASDGLGRNEDVISIVLEMFGDELYNQTASSRIDFPTEFLIQCTQFIHSLLPILPGRVWPFLGRSGLLGLNGVESRLINVVAVLEVPAGQFAFLLSTVHLFESLVEDAISHAVSRKGISTAANRFDTSDSDSNGSGITEALMQKILLHFEKIMIDIFESTNNWRFLAVHHKLEINTIICQIFERILSYCHDTDDNTELSKKLSSALAPSAEYLLDVFLSSSSNDLPLQPLIQCIREGVDTPTNTIPVHLGLARVALTDAAISLTDRLARTNIYLGRPSSRLEQQLFGSISAIAKCYSVHERYKLPVVRLLDAMVRGANRSSELPPSLLGHMGSETAKSFVDLLSILDQPLDHLDLGRYIWRLLSGVVSERQQWFAIYLLTGNTPKDSLKETSAQAISNSPPVLEVAITKLRRLPHIDLADAICVLEFLTSATDFWPSICEKVRNDAALIKAFQDFLANLDNPQTNRTQREPLLETHRFQLAAFISSIFAIIAHRRNVMHDDSFAKQILPSLSFLVQNGASTSRYNASLHSSLHKNFESRYSGCKLIQLKRTAICQPVPGDNFYFDVGFADRLLRYDSAWAPASGRGFFNELKLANHNLSLVEAQMNLFHGWKSLAVELSFALPISGEFQSSIASIIRECLTANLETALPERVFSRLAQSRASLVFTLLQRLIRASRGSVDAQSILDPAWEALRTSAPDLGLALTGSDSDYHRTLLKIVYLALQAYVTKGVSPGSTESVSRKTPDITNRVLEILSACAASGYRSLVSVIHEDVTKILPSDLALINGILRSCLHVPEVDRQTEHLASMFADEDTALYASTLLSWSHQLAIDRDPVFGELSLNFILELSSVPVLAEYVITAGTMGQIATANLMGHFRRPGGCGPFDEPARMYSLWARTLLPLVINLLTAIGAPIVGDIATFLNQFGPQLDRASTVLDTKISTTGYQSIRVGYVTLTMASEIHSLAMIASIFDMFREAGPSVGVAPVEIPELAWDRALVKSDLETRLQRRMTLREDIISTDEREEVMSREMALDAKSGAQSRLEERVVEELGAAMALLGDPET